MRAHGFGGGITVMGGDGIDDALVFGQRQLFGAGGAHQGGVELAGPAEHRFDDRGEDGIAADIGDLAMEGHVALDEFLQIDHRSAVRGNRLAQPCHLRRRGTFGGHAGGAGFQEDARLFHVPEHVRLGAQQMLGTRGDLRDQAVGGGIDHAGALAMGDLDEAGALHRLQRLAHGRTADAVLFHQITFGWQLRAGWKFALMNAIHEAFQDFLVELASLYRFRHGRAVSAYGFRWTRTLP